MIVHFLGKKFGFLPKNYYLCTIILENNHKY